MIKELSICILFFAMSLTAGMSAEQRHDNIEDDNNFIRNIRKKMFVDDNKNIAVKFSIDLNEEYYGSIIPIISELSTDIVKNYGSEIEVFENSLSCYLKGQDAVFSFPNVLYDHGLISRIVKKELKKYIENEYNGYFRKSKEKYSEKSSEEDEGLEEKRIFLDQARKNLESQIKVLKGNYSLHFSTYIKKNKDKTYEQNIDNLLGIKKSFPTYIQVNYDKNKDLIFKQILSDFPSHHRPDLYGDLNLLWDQKKKELLNIFENLIDNKIFQALQTKEFIMKEESLKVAKIILEAEINKMDFNFSFANLITEIQDQPSEIKIQSLLEFQSNSYFEIPNKFAGINILEKLMSFCPPGIAQDIEKEVEDFLDKKSEKLLTKILNKVSCEIENLLP